MKPRGANKKHWSSAVRTSWTVRLVCTSARLTVKVVSANVNSSCWSSCSRNWRRFRNSKTETPPLQNGEAGSFYLCLLIREPVQANDHAGRAGGGGDGGG